MGGASTASESIHVAAIPDDIAEDQPVDQSLPFYRTEEEFFRRYPAVPVEQQSFVSPMDSGVSSPVSRPAVFGVTEPNPTAVHGHFIWISGRYASTTRAGGSPG